MSTPGKGGFIDTVEDIFKTSYQVGQTITLKNIQEFTTLGCKIKQNLNEPHKT